MANAFKVVSFYVPVKGLHSLATLDESPTITILNIGNLPLTYIPRGINMKLFAAVAQVLQQTVAVVDAVGTAVTTLAQSTDILAQAGKDLASLAKNSTDQLLKEQQLEMRKDLLLLTRELEKEIVIEEGEFISL